MGPLKREMKSLRPGTSVEVDAMLPCSNGVVSCLWFKSNLREDMDDCVA